MSEEIQDVIQEARSMGWVPEEEWKGDTSKWRPAEEFVERGNMILPIVKKRLTEELSEVKKSLDTALKIRDAELQKIKDSVYKQAQKEFDQKLKDLKKREIEAVSEGDTKEWQKIQDEKESIEKAKVEPPKELPTETETPAFKTWKEDNDWYEKDDAATMIAMGYASKLTSQMNDGKLERLPEDEFYTKITEFVKSELPHKFENPNRKQPSLAEGSGHAAPSGGGKTWADVPASAKTVFNRQAKDMKSRGIELNKDEWVKTYFEG